jgi:peroxiredoxin Q/BCP
LLVLPLAAGCSPPKRPDGGSGLLPAGALAPDLVGVDQSGKKHRLRDTEGNPTVVYFYPKDGTPGCTTEACAFRDVWQKFDEAGVRLFGVSRDSQQSHAEFAQEHKLTFPLIADEDGRWATAFGVGTTFGMDSRVSFLLGPDGKVAKVYPDVDPGLHAAEVLADAKALGK